MVKIFGFNKQMLTFSLLILYDNRYGIEGPYLVEKYFARINNY